MRVPTTVRSLAIWIMLTPMLLLAAQGDRQGMALNEFIRHFEPLYVESGTLAQTANHRSRRSSKAEIRFQFIAHDRVFRLRMRPDKSVFSPDVVFESSSKGRIHFDPSTVLQGSLEDDDESRATGVLTRSGLFDGVVATAMDEFYIEPASRYFPEPTAFPAVIYRAADVRFPANGSCKAHGLSHCAGFVSHCTGSNCPSSLKKRKGQRKGSSSGNKRKRDHPHLPAGIPYWRDLDALHYRDEDYDPNEEDRGVPSAGEGAKGSGGGQQASDSEPYGVRSVQRTHWAEDRTDRHVIIDPRKSTCMLYLQADHLFYLKMGSEEACIETMTRHVQKVNSIYKNTDFDQDGRPDNISFLIKRIKVHTSESLRDPEYRFPGNYGVEKFLELFSEEDYDAFCLAYMFTYRDFEGGTLGLAWTGDLKNAGGVCEKNGHYRGSLKSLNTGIVTLLNYGKHVPPIVSHVTLAHEIGHNFGSPHDPEEDKICTPGGEHGNYIMFARATSGDKKNNNRFSPCSLKSINAVLNNKARSIRGCFTELQHAICGNEVVEPGEECDCGWEEDCAEPCCFPMRANAPLGEVPCRLRPQVVCSPSQGPCCTQDCMLKVGDKCREDNGCRSASFCDGRGPKCPLSIDKPNKTICNEKFVCYMGECTGSICVAYGLEACQCRRGNRDPPTKACELCCKLPGDDGSCRSSFEWNFPPYDVPDMHAKPGTPCDNYNGYCDVFQKCREVDPSGPLATLRRLLLSTESMASLRRWVLDHWWALVILFCGALVFLGVVVRVFGHRTDTKNCPDSESSSLTPTFRSFSNQGALQVKGVLGCGVRGVGGGVGASLVAALTAASSSSSSPSSGTPPVKSSLSFHTGEKPLAMNGNGWV